MRIVNLLIDAGVAGGQVVALRIAQAARDRGDDVAFVLPRPGPFGEVAEREGFGVAVADLNRTFNLGAATQLRRLLREADLLHTHTLAGANILSRLASTVPVVAHLHIENHFRAATAWLLRRLDNATARRCSRLVAVSEDTRRAYERQGYPRGRIEVVYNGIDLAPGATGDGARAALGVPDAAPLVGEVARLCDVKGQRELIEALPRLPGVHAVVVGDDLEQGGAYRHRLERWAAELGVADRVVFTGHHPDPRAILDELDVFVLPSWTEGLSIAMLEAMAHATPVVATPVGGTPEAVVDGETGLLVPPRNPAALAEAIGELLADRARAKRLGESGRRRVAERFSAGAMTGRMLEIYDEVAA